MSDSAIDPMVKITSLPIKQNKAEILTKISDYVAQGNIVRKEVVTFYWQTFEEIYCPGCELDNIKNPIFVDLYVPACMTKDKRKQIMIRIAHGLEKFTDYTAQEVFIYTHIAEMDQLYIKGDVVTDWKQVGFED